MVEKRQLFMEMSELLLELTTLSAQCTATHIHRGLVEIYSPFHCHRAIDWHKLVSLVGRQNWFWQNSRTGLMVQVKLQLLCVFRVFYGRHRLHIFESIVHSKILTLLITFFHFFLWDTKGGYITWVAFMKSWRSHLQILYKLFVGDIQSFLQESVQPGVSHMGENSPCRFCMCSSW